MLQPQMSPPAPIPVAFLNTRGVIRSLLKSFGLMRNIPSTRVGYETLFDRWGCVANPYSSASVDPISQNVSVDYF